MTESQNKNEQQVEVRYVADLARIALTEEEIQRYQQELEDVLGYMEKLNELDVSGIEPTAHARPMTNIMRDDEVEESEMSREEFLDNAPNTADDKYVRVPVVIEDEE